MVSHGGGLFRVVLVAKVEHYERLAPTLSSEPNDGTDGP
jgi:hypothetical protein